MFNNNAREAEIPPPPSPHNEYRCCHKRTEKDSKEICKTREWVQVIVNIITMLIVMESILSHIPLSVSARMLLLPIIHVMLKLCPNMYQKPSLS